MRIAACLCTLTQATKLMNFGQWHVCRQVFPSLNKTTSPCLCIGQLPSIFTDQSSWLSFHNQPQITDCSSNQFLSQYKSSVRYIFSCLKVLSYRLIIMLTNPTPRYVVHKIFLKVFIIYTQGNFNVYILELLC